MDGSMVAIYLEPYGYDAAGPEEWRTPPNACSGRPRLKLQLEGHSEAERHTFYSVRCSLTAETRSLQAVWPVQRRLVQLREGLHDVVKMELAKGYGGLFGDAPFAKKGGPRGTTERLHRWLETLAACVNDGAASPALVAQVLLFLDAPAQAGHRSLAEAPGGPPQPEAVGGPPQPEAPAEARGRGPAGPAATAAVPGTPRSARSASLHSARGALSAPHSARGAVSARSAVSPRFAPPPQPWEALAGARGPGPGDPEAGALVPKFLEPYGYFASGPGAWGILPAMCKGGPMLQLSVSGHAKVGGRQHYSVQCQLSSARPPMQLEWQVQRDLKDLREGLHDVAKRVLGKAYEQAFRDTPFAKMRGPSGTTERLHRWLGGLAACANAGVAPPALVAVVLAFLRPPAPVERRPRTPRLEAVTTDVEAVTGEAPAPPTIPTPSDADAGAREGAQAGYDSAGVTDDEGAAFSPTRRRAGYRKLRDWFKELRKALVRKLDPEGELSPRRPRSQSPAGGPGRRRSPSPWRRVGAGGAWKNEEPTKVQT